MNIKLEHVRGEQSPAAKLTEAEAQSIVDASNIDEVFALADEYKIGREYARKIWNRKSWPHLCRTSEKPKDPAPRRMRKLTLEEGQALLDAPTLRDAIALAQSYGSSVKFCKDVWLRGQWRGLKANRK